MSLTLEMPAGEVGQDVGFTPGPADDASLDAATEAADLLDQADAEIGDELPPADGWPGGQPFDPDIANSMPASDRPDPPDGFTTNSDGKIVAVDPPAEPAKKKRGRKKKSEQPADGEVSIQHGQPSESPSPLVQAIVSGEGIVEAIAASPGPTPGETAAANPQEARADKSLPDNDLPVVDAIKKPVSCAPPITRAERIAELTADLVEVVLECEECESTIDRAKSRLKLLSEQRTELSDELRSVRDNEQWQPPLLKLPKQSSEPAGTEAESQAASSVNPADAPPAAAQSARVVDDDADPDAWKAVPIDDLGLPPKLADKLREANAETIGRLENLRAEISQGREKWPKGIGKARITEIENAIVDWLSKNRDAAVLAAASGQVTAESPAEPPAITPAVAADAATAIPTFDQWESMLEDQQQEYICARAVIIDDGTENSLATKHPKGSQFWDSGYAAFGRGEKVSECPYVPGPEMDDWIRGWLGHGAVEKFEPDAKAASTEAKSADAKATDSNAVTLDELLT